MPLLLKLRFFQREEKSYAYQKALHKTVNFNYWMDISLL